jgi:methylmalonyl-CoA mutase N-terminal domain/subunit
VSQARWPSRADIVTGGVSHTESGIPIHPDWTLPDALGAPPPPGVFPFLRGIRGDGYHRRPWTFRQYAGFGSGEDANERFRYLVDQGQNGLSVALDLPTQMGLDSDDERAQLEVGRLGVAIDTVDDMERLFAGIPIETISTSFTINATAPVILAMYVLVADRRGIPRKQLSGTVQNDILKEFVARGAYLYPPEPSLRLCADVIEFCASELPKFNPISIASAHIKSAGATPVAADGLMLANGVEYAHAVVNRGIPFDRFGGQLSFLTSSYRDVFESIARFRACRAVWAEIARDQFGATDPRAMQFRFHAGGDIDAMTFEEPVNNVARMALNAFAGGAGGCQSMQLPCYDEPYEIPTEEAVLNALRVQQIVALESGLRAVPDPFAGSYFIEGLTDRIADEFRQMLGDIEADGGALHWIETGRTQAVIANEARVWEERVDSGADIRVADNYQRSANDRSRDRIQVHHADPESARRQVSRLAEWRHTRDSAPMEGFIARLEKAARDGGNIMQPLVDALDAGATVGEISAALERCFGRFRPPVTM